MLCKATQVLARARSQAHSFLFPDPSGEESGTNKSESHELQRTQCHSDRQAIVHSILHPVQANYNQLHTVLNNYINV